MKRTFTASSALFLTFTLAACGAETTEATPADDTAIEYRENPNVDLPVNSGAECSPRPVVTSEDVTILKDAKLTGGKAEFDFAPQHSEFSSYSYQLTFDNGVFFVNDFNSNPHEAFVKIGVETTPVPIGLSGGYYSASFEIPADLLAQLGNLRFMDASINGELAGTCGS